MKKIAIFGVPRSGTSWLAQIFNSHPDVVLRFQPLFSYGHKGALNTDSSAEDIRTFFDEILHSTDKFALMKADMQKDYPIFEKSSHPTHIVFKETRYLHIIGNLLFKCDEVRIIGIVRNPLAVLASWVTAPREYSKNWDILREWRNAQSKNQGRPEEFFGYEKWKEAAASFLDFRDKYPKQFMLVRYDSLNRRPLDSTKQMFEFCGLEVGEQVEAFLKASKSRHDSDPYSVYRGDAQDSRWREVLPVEIVNEIALDLEHTPLEAFLRNDK